MNRRAEGSQAVGRVTPRTRRGVVRDVFGLTVGTLTRIPVPAPRRIDRRITGWAMSLAPLVGIVLGVAAAAILAALDAFTDVSDPLTALLVAVVIIAFGAWVTRGLHLDGLADLADALGSRKPTAQALDIAKRSDIGPFGVMAVVFVLLTQVSALAKLVTAGLGPVAIVIAMTAGRLAIPLAARRGVPAARPDGLGAMVAGTVPRLVPLIWALAVAGLARRLVIDATGDAMPFAGAIAVVAAAIVAAWVLRIARKRLGGMTGDVIGAAVELTTTATLLALALLV